MYFDFLPMNMRYMRSPTCWDLGSQLLEVDCDPGNYANFVYFPINIFMEKEKENLSLHLN